jgi:hypothetical protein
VKRLYLGIDPGVSGALCRLDGSVITVWDTPTYPVAMTSGKNRSEYDDHLMLANLRQVVEQAKLDGYEEVHAAIESAQFRAGQDVTSIGRVGIGWGRWWMALCAMDIVRHEVAASTWKGKVFKGTGLAPPKAVGKALGLDKEELARLKRERDRQNKNASRELAKRLWPKQWEYFKLADSHNRAEAALIAYYLRSLHAGEFEGQKKAKG